MKLFSVNNFWLLNDKLMTPLENSQAKVLVGGGRKSSKVLLHSHEFSYS